MLPEASMMISIFVIVFTMEEEARTGSEALTGAVESIEPEGMVCAGSAICIAGVSIFCSIFVFFVSGRLQKQKMGIKMVINNNIFFIWLNFYHVI